MVNSAYHFNLIYSSLSEPWINQFAKKNSSTKLADPPWDPITKHIN